MKKVFVLLIASLLICISVIPCSAKTEIGLEINKLQYMNLSDTDTSVSSHVPQIRLKVNIPNNLFLFGSFEITDISYIGQSALHVTWWGAGLGYNHVVNNKLSLSFDAGYYFPNTEYSHSSNEGHWLYMNKKTGIDPVLWDSYKTEINGTVGIGVQLEAKIYKNVSFVAGLRYLVATSNMYGWNKDEGMGDGHGYWTLDGKTDVTAYKFGLVITY